jgi:hypothetical protein
MINIGELYNKHPKALNAFYDWLDDKYNIVDYIDRFKQYLFNDVMFKRYMFEFLKQHGYCIYVDAISFDKDDNAILFKFSINNVGYENNHSDNRFECELKSIEKSLSLLEKLL